MTGITPRHPTQELPVVDDEVGERELVGVEQEGGNAKRKYREPEVDEVRCPDGHGRVQEEQEVPHSHVDAGAREPGVEDGERLASGGESTTGSDIASTTERQIALDGLRVNLR